MHQNISLGQSLHSMCSNTIEPNLLTWLHHHNHVFCDIVIQGGSYYSGNRGNCLVKNRLFYVCLHAIHMMSVL